MPRQPRIFLPDVSAHLIHRGNNRMDIFKDQGDYLMLLSLLARSATKHGVRVHGYVLMTNHIHLIATPEGADSVPNGMKELAGRYARFFNDEQTRIGTLWNGRYRAILIDTEAYWLTCLRYIEQNPVRAGMVERPEDYRWSSYAAHAHGHWPPWLTPHPLYLALGTSMEARQQAYRALCAETVTREEIVPPQAGVRRVSDP